MQFVMVQDSCVAGGQRARPAAAFPDRADQAAAPAAQRPEAGPP